MPVSPLAPCCPPLAPRLNYSQLTSRREREASSAAAHHTPPRLLCACPPPPYLGLEDSWARTAGLAALRGQGGNLLLLADNSGTTEFTEVASRGVRGVEG